MTFLQAKYSRQFHNCCQFPAGSPPQGFKGVSHQWDLLHRRPLLDTRANKKFQVPANLLSGALLSSVCTYGVFHCDRSGLFDMFYASADVISSPRPAKPGAVVTLTASTNPTRVTVNGLTEQKWACCIKTFGDAVYAGYVGTPVFPANTSAGNDIDWHRDVRRWLGGIIGYLTVRKEIGPVIRSFVEQFDIPISDFGTPPPTRSLVFIQGD